MGNPRKPADLAEITGATVVNPGRHESRARPKVAKVGAPYARMTDVAKEYWAEYAADIPWLARSDRSQLEMLCELKAEQRQRGVEFPFNKLNMIRQILNSFGGSASDRTRVGVSLGGLRTLEEESPPESHEPSDPASEFIN